MKTRYYKWIIAFPLRGEVTLIHELNEHNRVVNTWASDINYWHKGFNGQRRLVDHAEEITPEQAFLETL